MLERYGWIPGRIARFDDLRIDIDKLGIYSGSTVTVEDDRVLEVLLPLGVKSDGAGDGDLIFILICDVSALCCCPADEMIMCLGEYIGLQHGGSVIYDALGSHASAAGVAVEGYIVSCVLP